MKARRSLTCVALTAALLTLGCAQKAAPSAEDYEAAREKKLEYRRQAPPKKPLERVPEGEDVVSEEALAPVPGDLIAAIVADAARERGIDPTLVQVLSAQRIDWPDGSLGCPEPGQMYTQAIVPGYQVRVSAAGRPLDYRSDLAGRFFVCGPERLNRPGPAQ